MQHLEPVGHGLLGDLGVEGQALPAMGTAGADVQLDGDVGDGQLARVLDVLVAEEVEGADVDVGRRQAGGVGDAGGRRVRRDGVARLAGLHGGDRVARHGGPRSQVVPVVPDDKRTQAVVRLDGAVVEHRVDEDLFGQRRRQVPVAREDGARRRHTAAAAIAHDRDARRVDVQRGRVRVQPRQAGEAVFCHGRAAVLLVGTPRGRGIV